MIEDGALAREGDLALRRMLPTDEDFARLLAWRREPHVRAVWDTDDDEGEFTDAGIRAAYGPLTDPSDPTVATFIEVDGRPAGYLQFYPWSAYADEAEAMGVPVDGGTWGLDIFLGDPSLLATGIGPRAVVLLSRYLRQAHGATRVALLTAVDNERAQRAYEKAGMRKAGRRLDLDTRDGVRVDSWLMIRDLDDPSR